jgi:hypothetical protein
VPQVVGAALSFGASPLEVCDLPAHGTPRRMGLRDLVGERRCAGEGVEDRALRVGVEQRLRLVLPVKIDEVPPDLGEHAGTHRGAVDPRAGATGRGHLTLQHHE